MSAMTYFQRLRNFWLPDKNVFLWFLFSLPALYFFQTTIHEGTHALAAYFVTGHLPTVAPFPHDHGTIGPLNGVTLFDPQSSATVIERTECDSAAVTKHTRLAGWAPAPQFVDLFLIAIFSLITFFVPVGSALLRFPVLAWYFAANIDFMYNTARGLVGSCNKVRDWSKFMIRDDINETVFLLLTWILWLGVLSHFVWVYRSRWGRDAVPKTDFWDYTWIALGLGILGFIGVLFSIFVNDPDIHKDSVIFIVPFIALLGATAWYWYYFVQSIRRRSS
jgi:hypothetical protein